MERQVYDQMADVQDRHWWFLGRRRILTDAIARHVPLENGARILEAGCGTGGNLEMLARFGRVSAFDPDQGALDYAQGQGDFELRQGGLPDEIPFEGGSFDLIAALDVIEHVDDDRASLAALAERLSPRGALLLTVPAFPFLWSEHDVSHHHRRRYVKRELTKLAREAGLVPVLTTYYNSLLFPLIAGVRLAQKLLPLPVAGDDVARTPGLLNRLLLSVFASERHLVGRLSLPAGVSLIMLARRA